MCPPTEGAPAGAPLQQLITYCQSTFYMKKIGIYYHPSFSRKSYLTGGHRLRGISWSVE